MRAVVSVVALLLATHGGRTSAQQAVSGHLSLVWGDPASGGPAQLVAYLASSDGQKTRLRFESGSEPSWSELAPLQGHTVTAIGAMATAATSTEATLQTLRVDRAAAPAPGTAPAASSLEFGAITGAQPWVTLRCRFGDMPTVDRAINTSVFTGSAYPSIDLYWREASYDNINLTGSALADWVNLPQPRSFYVPTGGAANLSALADDCVAASDAQVNFSQFVGINMLFNDALDCCLWGGGMWFNLDGTGQVWRTTWIGLPQDNYYALFAGLAHETGHGFGLPHSSGPYSQTYDSRWDIMSNAWIRWDSAIGMYSPQGTIAYHKNLGGWIPSGRKFVPPMNSQTTISIERLAVPISSSNYLMAQIPIGGSATDYYTVEFRDRVGQDAWVPATCVVIHKVNTSGGGSHARVVDPDSNGNPNDGAAIWQAGETFTDSVAGISIRIDSLNATSATVTIALGAPVGQSIIGTFSGLGLARYDPGPGWRSLHPVVPEDVVVADVDANGIEDLVVDFGSAYGLWIFKNNATWALIHGASPTRLATGDLDGNGRDEVIASFAGAGVWGWYNDASWTRIHSSVSSVFTAANIDGTGGDDLVVVFAGYGTWTLRNNATWAQIHSIEANLVAGGRLDASAGAQDLIVGFPGYGLYQYANNATWTPVHSVHPMRVAVGDLDGNGRDDLVVDFGTGLGIWSLTNGTTWAQIHSLTAESIAVGDVTPNGRADIALDFGAGHGMWLRSDTGSWTQLHTSSPMGISVADLN